MRLALISLLMIPLVFGCDGDEDKGDDCCGGDDPPWMCDGGEEFEAGDRSCQGDDFSNFEGYRTGWSQIVECQTDGSLTVIEECRTVRESGNMAGCSRWSVEEEPECDVWDAG